MLERLSRDDEMSLNQGSRLGAYEIVCRLGAGGMGEVYRARDTRLHRDVAIKILPDVFATDPDRLARFEREALTLAALNHPHIAHVFGLEAGSADDEASRRALVMELVDGEDLSERLKRGPIPLEDALPLAQQIAEALEAAHEQGIVHRDLKPANVKIRPDGNVKVLDFGLAKAFDKGSGIGDQGSEDHGGSIANSPTITSPAMTVRGTILGTASYMSPEQAKGKAVDKRADIWAFGCVLFEMLTAQRLFDGQTVSDTLADVLRKPIEWTGLPADTPAPIRELLRKCLVRETRQRLRDIGDARLILEDSLRDPAAMSGGKTVGVPPRSFWRLAVPIIVTAFAAMAATAGAFRWVSSPPGASSAQPITANILLGDGLTMTPAFGTAFALSPDGKVLAFVATKGTPPARAMPFAPPGKDGSADGIPRLYVRSLDRLESRLLAGTEDASVPFFSPDGQRLAFFARGKLSVVHISGGAVATIADVADQRGGTWGPDGSIIFTPHSSPGITLMRVSSAGGSVQAASKLEGAEVTHRWPQMLPDGASVLYTAHAQTGSYDQASLVVAALDGTRRTVVHQGGYFGRYVGTGHLVFIHKHTLFAVPFDLTALKVTGPAVPVIEGVTSDPTSAEAQFSVSDKGALVYARGEGLDTNFTLTWADASGAIKPMRTTPDDYHNPRFSPDGHRLAFDIGANWGESAIWTYDIARDIPTRLTFGGALDMNPVWTPDGKRIAFASQRSGLHVENMYWQSAGGTGAAQRLLESARPQWPWSWHPDGRRLAFFEELGPSNTDVGILTMEGSDAEGWKIGSPTMILTGPYPEADPAFSPDGRFLAYTSMESGRPEIYVRTFPSLQGHLRVSTDGGVIPAWSTKASELFYGTLDGRIMVASYQASGETLTPARPREWAAPVKWTAQGFSRMFDLHPDGRRFALLRGAEMPVRDHITFVSNFFDVLRLGAREAQR